MTQESMLSVGDRLVQLLDHLQIPKAHVCARSPVDILSLVATAPDRIASVTLQGGTSWPDDFVQYKGRILWLLGDQGDSAKTMVRRLAAQDDSAVHWLERYPEYTWSDTVTEHREQVSAAFARHFTTVEEKVGLTSMSLSSEGEVGGISYRANGSGTPVLLLPLGLSAHQWDAVLPALEVSHCLIRLGGKHLQPVENLEARADSGYAKMALDLLDLAGPQPGDSLLEVGCGPGALLRRIARRDELKRVVGLDVNSFFLREARALALSDGLGKRLEFQEGSAEAIPFPDDMFDITFSSTVMEEVDAGRMMSELVRVTRPGGRVAVAVRAVDRGQWTNLPLPQALKTKIETSTGAVTAKGCADESLYRRFHGAGLQAVRGGPSLVPVQPDDPWWRNLAVQLRASLTPDEAGDWDAAIAKAQAEHLPFWLARPFHCAVGRKG